MAAPPVVPIGFTGTREGYDANASIDKLGERGKTMFAWLAYLRAGFGAIEGHHGDCDGSDAKFHVQCRAMGIPRVVHPPINPKHRAFVDKTDAAYGLTKSNYTKVLPPGTYLDRDWDIVNVSKALLATPKTRAEEPGSGTWATINMARGARIWIIIVHADGTWEDEGPRPLWCGIRDDRLVPVNPDDGHRWDGDHCIVCGFDSTDALAFKGKNPTCQEWRSQPCTCKSGQSMMCSACASGFKPCKCWTCS